MSQVIEFLRQFNRKERFILLDHVLGAQGAEVFRLSPGFRGELGKELGLNVPKNAFVAMDYHLDWIQMALYFAGHGTRIPEERIPNQNLFKANQRDVDLLIAFNERGVSNPTHIVMIEAKADTSWNNKQLKKKAARLKLIFDKNPYCRDIVKPHFVLMSPGGPTERRRIDVGAWPSWMRGKETSPAHWLKLPLRDGLVKVSRCNASGRDDEHGEYLQFTKSVGAAGTRTRTDARRIIDEATRRSKS